MGHKREVTGMVEFVCRDESCLEEAVRVVVWAWLEENKKKKGK